MINKHSKSASFQWKSVRRVSGNVPRHTLCILSFASCFWWVGSSDTQKKVCDWESADWIPWSQLQRLRAVWPWAGHLLCGNFSFVSFVTDDKDVTTPAPLTSWIFFPKNQLKSGRCKCSVNYSASQVYGYNISTVYSWTYRSGINIARKLAIFCSVFKILYWILF